MHAFQLGLGFQFCKQHNFFWYDFIDFLVEEMIGEIENYLKEWKFKFLSFLAHMFLHQNPDFFNKYVGLSIFDEKGRRKPVSTWTPLLFATFDYYAFS